MAHHYSMTVQISSYRGAHGPEIVKAICEEWNFEDGTIDSRGGIIEAQSDDYLIGDEDEFADRLVRSIWKANAGYCEVEVNAAYLDNPPTETYSFKEKEYAEMTGRPV